jgi:hypothetical protein
MTNHPRRGYQALVRRLTYISVAKDMAPDVRRIARDHYSTMMVARQPIEPLPSKASYYNQYGFREAAEAARAADERHAKQRRSDSMADAQNEAEAFLAAWGLAP